MSDDAFLLVLIGAPVLFIIVVVILLRSRRWKHDRAAWQIEAARKACEEDKTWQRPPEPSMPYQPPPEPEPIRLPDPPAPRKVRKRRPATVKQTKRLRAIKRRGKGKGA